MWSPKIFHRKATCRCEVARRAEIEAFRIPSHWNVRQHQESVDRCALSEAHSDAAQHNKIKSSTLANSDSPNGFILCQYGRMLEIEGRQKKKKLPENRMPPMTSLRYLSEWGMCLLPNISQRNHSTTPLFHHTYSIRSPN